LNKKFAVFPALVLGFAVLANSQTPAPAAAAGPPPTKIGIINAAGAIVATKEGAKAMDEFQKTVVAPKREAVDKLQATITADTDRLRKGSATMSLDAQKKLQADIDANTKTFNRSTEDAQAEVSEQQGKIFQELGTKMMTILAKYGTDNGFAVVLDVSNQQTSVLWAASGIDVTSDIVKLYDEKYPLSAVAAPAAPAAPAAAKPPATPPKAPATPPAAKKQ
jgi:outer membrane protein